MIGVFAALDLVLFYIFWEAVLIPMYLIIGVWGGPRRVYAAVKFILYTVAGSLLMLVAILYLYFAYHAATGEFTFDLIRLYETPLGRSAQLWLFAAFALAFAIKVPMFPFHTWLPDAHVEAPTAGSVILAGVLLKMGTYGFVRFAMPLFPEATLAFAPWMILLAVIGIIYGALVAMVQPDVKKLVAYSSVSHLGFVMLGLFALNTQGIQGGILQMVNHGLSTGALFLAVGMIYERRHTREISEFGGLAAVVPWFAAGFLVICLSSLGLPGLNGFIGEFLILLGAFRMNPYVAGISATGVILAAVYLLWMYQRVMFGPVTNEKNRGLRDLTAREFWTLAPVIALIIWIGVYPNPFLRKLDMSVGELMERMSARTLASRMEPAAPGTTPVGGAATAEPGTDGAPDAEAAPEAAR
jgi:NADH-quinone oxidoreductase subunit M